VKGDDGFFLGFHALGENERADFVEEPRDADESAARGRVLRGAGDHGTVELHDVGVESPDAVEVGMAGAEVVDGDEAAEIAVVAGGVLEGVLILGVGLGDFDDDALGLHAGGLQGFAEERAVGASVDDHFRADVEEEPGGVVGRAVEVGQVEGTEEAVEKDDALAGAVGREEGAGRDRLAAFVPGAREAFEAHGAVVGEAVDGLVGAADAEVAVLGFDVAVLTSKVRREVGDDGSWRQTGQEFRHVVVAHVGSV